MTKKIPKIIGMHKRYLASEKYSLLSWLVQNLGSDIQFTPMFLTQCWWHFCVHGGPWDGPKSHRRRRGHVHVTLRWLKIRTVQFLFNFSSKCPSRVKTLSSLFLAWKLKWLRLWTIFASNSICLRILSHLKVTRTWPHLLQWLFEPSQGPPCIWTSFKKIMNALTSMRWKLKINLSVDVFINRLS